MLRSLPAPWTVLFFAYSVAVAARPVTVRIVDSQGSSIPGAQVQFYCAADAEVVSATTGQEGSAEAECPLPTEVQAQAVGFEPARLRIESSPAGGGPVEITLRPAPIRTSIDVVVTPERVETVTTGSAMQVERLGARTVFDAVEKLVPSVFVTRRGVMGYGIATNGTGGVSIRGVGGSPNTQVLVVVDGRPDVMGLMGHPLPDFYSLSDVGSVRVTEGPASVLYGSNAMGGAVEISPARPEPGYRTRLDTSLGSYWTGMHRLAHGAQFDRWAYHLTAGVSHTSGDRPSSDFRNQDGSFGLAAGLNDHWKASLDGRYGHFHVEDPGPVTQPLQNSYANVGRGGFSAGVENAYVNAYGYVRAYGGYGNHYITDGFRSTDSTTGVRGVETLSLGERMTLETGVDYTRYGGVARNVLVPLDYGEHQLSETAGFARLNWNAASRLRLLGGYRYQRHSLYGGISVPEAGLSYWLTSRFVLSASFARGFRNPTIRELYLFPAPNPSLRPEAMWNYQGTFEARLTRSVQAWSTFYYADLTDQIVTLGQYPNLRLENAGSAINKGFDANLRWRLARPLHITAGYAYLRSTNLAPLVPGHKFNLAADVLVKTVRLSLSTMTVNSRFADVRKTQALGGYTLASLKVDVPVGRRLTLFGLVDNLLDRSYQVVQGYPMPGANAMGGLTVAF